MSPDYELFARGTLVSAVGIQNADDYCRWCKAFEKDPEKALKK